MLDQGKDKARRVLIIVENSTVPYDTRVWQEAKTLRNAGYEVGVICPSHPDAKINRETLEGIEIYRHPLPRGAGISAYWGEYLVAIILELWLVLKVALTRGVDVIHGCNPPDTIFLIGGLFKFILGTKFLFDHHDLSPELYKAKFRRQDFMYRLLLVLERWTYKVTDVALVTNESYRQVALARGGMDPRKVFLVRNGPDLDRFKIVPPVTLLKQGRRYLVCYVGHLSRQKGAHYLLAAVRHIVHDCARSDLHFAIAGDGPELDNLRLMARELQIAEWVTFTGFLPPNDPRLLELLCTADICVCTLENTEMNNLSTAMKVMEYMALSKPIVQFDLKEARYTAQDAALYAEPDNPIDFARNILELADDPLRRSEMGKIGRQRVESVLAWSHQATRLLAAYQSLWEPSSHAPWGWRRGGEDQPVGGGMEKQADLVGERRAAAGVGGGELAFGQLGVGSRLRPT